MPKTVFAYGLLDERLRALGFTPYAERQGEDLPARQDGRKHHLARRPFDEEVLRHHLTVIRHVLKEHNLDAADGGQVIPCISS